MKKIILGFIFILPFSSFANVCVQEAEDVLVGALNSRMATDTARVQPIGEVSVSREQNYFIETHHFVRLDRGGSYTVKMYAVGGECLFKQISNDKSPFEE